MLQLPSPTQPFILSSVYENTAISPTTSPETNQGIDSMEQQTGVKIFY
jgi:hypothetical protein